MTPYVVKDKTITMIMTKIHHGKIPPARKENRVTQKYHPANQTGHLKSNKNMEVGHPVCQKHQLILGKVDVRACRYIFFNLHITIYLHSK